jgi:tetratricopeptide (TPR) repeat protein
VYPGAGPPGLGHDPEQPGQRPHEARGAGKPGTERLEEAVAAYQAALQEYTRERVPLDWAMTQDNLGSALWPSSGSGRMTAERLEEAVAAYQAALKERTRERVPFQWARTQNNLGSALCEPRGAGAAALSAWRRRWRLTGRPCKSIPGSGSPWSGP